MGIARNLKKPIAFSFYDALSCYAMESSPILYGGILVGATLALISWLLDSFSLIIVFLGIIIGAIIGAVISRIIYCKEYKSSMRSYELESQKDKERLEKELKLIHEHRENEKLYAQNISSCEYTLKQLYNLDIIFPKYRNFVAISQIYEYFMSGRCTELEGHEGAYNIFENELRQNVIITQLNDVLSNLEEIKTTQYMIYDALCEANSRLAHIENNTEAIAYNTAVIAENSTICARYYNN